MSRLGALVAAAALAVAPRVALADAKRKVTVETLPPGAKVYLNDEESGAACDSTPCTFDAPLGDTPLIIELAGYAPSITTLTVAKGRGTLKIPVIKLDSAGGGGIDAKALPGGKAATIKVDDQDKGAAPAKIAIDAGPHHVAYFVDGKQVYEEDIVVEPGDDFYQLTPKLSVVPPGPQIDEPNNPLKPDPAKDVHEEAPAPRRRGIATLSALVDIGFRHFTYDMPRTANLREDTEGGQVLAGPLIELYPTALIAPGKLPGLALLFRFEFGVNSNAVEGMGLTGPLTTFWQSFEISLRHRWVIGGKGTIEASGGYVRDRFQFNGNEDDIALVPDADYQSVRFGARGSLLLGKVEPYLSFENRVVVSAGSLSTRFKQSSTNGIHAALGLAYKSGAFGARLEGQITRYGSTFSANGVQDPMFDADAGTDLIEFISISAGYTY